MTALSPVQKQAIDNIVRQAADQSGLAIHWVASRSALNLAARNGLLELYRDVFAEPPYDEVFSEDDVKDFFAETLDSHGLIFTASCKDEFNKVSAFVSSLPLKAKKSVADHVAAFVDIEKTAYFAEDGVAKKLRRKGVSGVMKRLLLESNKIAGFNQVLLRTSIESYPQIAAVIKAGGSVIADLFQQVASPKQNGLTATDTRVFYLFNDGKKADCDVLSRVKIIRVDQQDVAVVRDDIPGNLQADIVRRMRENYAGIKQVVFSNAEIDDKPTLFDSRIYLPR